MRYFLVPAAFRPASSHALGPGRLYDLLVRNGRIIDGTGSPWYAGDIGIRDGRIAAIGRLDGPMAADDDRRRWPGRGAGLHRHAGAVRADHPGRSQLPSKIFQGITTEIHRRRRLSVAPLNDSIIAADRSDYEHFKITPGLADTGRVLCPARDDRGSESTGELRRRDPGPPHGAGRRRSPTQRRRAGTHEGDWCGMPCGGRSGRLDRPAISAGALRQDRELVALAAEAARSGASTRPTCVPNRTTSSTLPSTRLSGSVGRPSAGGDLAPQGGGQAQLGPDAAGRGKNRLGATRRSGHRGRHVRLHGLVQLAVGLRSALGA